MLKLNITKLSIQIVGTIDNGSNINNELLIFGSSEIRALWCRSLCTFYPSFAITWLMMRLYCATGGNFYMVHNK